MRLPPLLHAAFATTEIGWAGGNGFVLGTDDGGRTWVSQWNGSGTIIGISAVDRDHAWALVATTPGLGAANVLLATVDGHSWESQPIGLPLTDLSMAGPNVGWAIVSRSPTSTTADYLASTADGGRTWRAARLKSAVDAVCASGTGPIWATGRKGIFASRDGGQAWTQVADGPAPGSLPALQTAVHCIGSAAWVLANGGSTAGQQAYQVNRTLGGGGQWDLVLSQPSEPFASPVPATLGPDAGPFALLSATDAGFVGSCPSCGVGKSWTFTRTTDGGATFTAVTLSRVPTGDVVTDVSFVDPMHGWICGSGKAGGFVLLTSDGGQTWRLRS